RDQYLTYAVFASEQPVKQCPCTLLPADRRRQVQPATREGLDRELVRRLRQQLAAATCDSDDDEAEDLNQYSDRSEDEEDEPNASDKEFIADDEESLEVAEGDEDGKEEPEAGATDS